MVTESETHTHAGVLRLITGTFTYRTSDYDEVSFISSSSVVWFAVGYVYLKKNMIVFGSNKERKKSFLH